VSQPPRIGLTGANTPETLHKGENNGNKWKTKTPFQHYLFSEETINLCSGGLVLPLPLPLPFSIVHCVVA